MLGQRCRPWASIEATLAQCILFSGRSSPIPVQSVSYQTLVNAGVTLGQRLQRWLNVKPALFDRVRFRDVAYCHCI